MATYGIQGNMGAGKSLMSVRRIQMYMLSGLPCAANFDIYPEKLLPWNSKATITRIPDFPSASDLWSLGNVNPTPDEKNNGLLVLDESAVLLSSREWRDSGRGELITYLRHGRKQGFDIAFLSQDLESIDKSVRKGLIEHRVTCRRTDRLPIPFLGWFLKAAGFAAKLPKLHFAVVRYGLSEHSPFVETWWAWATKSLYEGYNTKQIFLEDGRHELRPVQSYWKHFRPFSTPVLVPKSFKPVRFDLAGNFTQLSAWHLRGRYLPHFVRYRSAYLSLFAFLALFSLANLALTIPTTVMPVVALQPSIEKADGVMVSGNTAILFKSGSLLHVTEIKPAGDKSLYRSGATWYEVD